MFHYVYCLVPSLRCFNARAGAYMIGAAAYGLVDGPLIADAFGLALPPELLRAWFVVTVWSSRLRRGGRMRSFGRAVDRAGTPIPVSPVTKVRFSSDIAALGLIARSFTVDKCRPSNITTASPWILVARSTIACRMPDPVR